MKPLLSKIIRKTKQNRLLLQNFSYLSALSTFNMLVPILTYPYLIRVLGKDIYGLVIYSQVIVSYLLILVNFGFETSATKDVSIHREDKKKLSEIFSSVIIIKTVLFLISIVILLAFIPLIPLINSHKLLIWLSMWICLYDVLFPVWLFQGLEKMKYITWLTLISRSLFISLIFFLVKSPSDYLMIPIINGIGGMIAGVLAIAIVLRKERLTFYFPSIQIIIGFFRNSVDYFISNISAKIYVFSNKFIIGTFLGMTNLAYYDLADKIIALFRNVPMEVVRNTLYPRIAKTKNMAIVRKTTVVMTLFAVFSVIVINIFAPQIIVLFGGTEMLPSLSIVRIFSLIIIADHVQHYYMTVGLWSLGYSWLFRNMMVISLLLFITLYFLIWIFGLLNIYTVTIIPIIIDLYLIIHVFWFWQKHNLSQQKLTNKPNGIY